MAEFLCPSILRLGYPYSDRYQALFRIFTSISESSLRVIVLSLLIDPYPEFNTEQAKCNAQTRLPIYRVRISSWISSWIFELDFRVRIFLAGFFGGVSNKFSVVLHNVLCQRCCTSS